MDSPQRQGRATTPAKIEALFEAITQCKSKRAVALVNELAPIGDRVIVEALDRAFLEACKKGMLAVVKAIVPTCDVNTLTKSRDNALHVAAEEGHADIVAELLNTRIRVDAKNAANQTPLLVAATAGHIDVLEVLAQHRDCDINAVDDEGRSGLGIAAFQGQSGVVAFFLGSLGIDVNVQDRFGATPLMLAVTEGHAAVVDLLVAHPVDLDVVDSEHRTALVCALDDEDDAHVDLATQLVAAGADVNIANLNGYSALHLAIQLGSLELARQLLEVGAAMEATTAPDYGRDTPLTLALDLERNDIAHFLIASGALVNVSNSEAKTPLHLAVDKQNGGLVEALLDKGADIEATDLYGSTALMVAAVEKRDLAMTQLLLAHDAKIDTSNNNADTLLSLAAMTQHREIALLLYTTYYAAPKERALLVPSATALSTVHVGDLVYFMLAQDDDSHVLGADGYLHTELKVSPVNDWLDHLFVIHPQLSYDHVSVSAFNEAPAATLAQPDPYSEEEREKKRNQMLLSQALSTTTEVQYNTTYQLLHVKSQKYLRMNPLAAPGSPNVSLDAQGSCYSWFQFVQLAVPSTGKEFDEAVATSTPLSLVSACLGDQYAASAQRAKTVVLVPPKSSLLAIGMYAHHEASAALPRVLQQPCHLLVQDAAVACLGQRLVPLAAVLDTLLQPAPSMDSAFAVELLVANDEDWYQLRHVGTRYVLGLQCPCVTRGYNIPAVLLHEDTETMTMAALRMELGADLRASFVSSCVRCGHLWHLIVHKDKLYWSPDKGVDLFRLEPIPADETQMLYEVYHWRESYLKLAHAALTQASPERMAHIIHHVATTTRQICELMDRQFEEDEENARLKAYKTVCIDMDILDAIFMAAACLDYIPVSDEFLAMLGPFWKALRFLIVGNAASERYLLSEFDASHGKIKIINALSNHASVGNVDCTAIIATLIAKNPNSLELFLDQSSVRGKPPAFAAEFARDPIRTMQLLIAMSSSDRSRLSFLTAAKLEDHEAKVATLLLQHVWADCCVETIVDPNTGDLAVTWAAASGNALLLRGDELQAVPEASVAGGVASMPLLTLGKSIQPHLKTLWTDDFTRRAQRWCIFYLHQLKLVSVLCRHNASCRRLLAAKFPLDVLQRVIESVAMKSLPYAFRGLFLQLFQVLHLAPPAAASQDLRLTTWFLNLDSRGALPADLDENAYVASVAQESVKALIAETLNACKAPNNYFAFVYHVLELLDTVLDLGWYTASPSFMCGRFLKTLFAAGMSWELVTPVVYPDINSDMDPFDLLGATTLSMGVNKVVLCQRRLLAVIAKVTQLFVLRSIEYTMDYLPEASDTMVQYLSTLACHADPLLAEAAMLNVAQILPAYNFAWLRVDYAICQKLKRVNADLERLRSVYRDANAVLDARAHEMRFTLSKEDAKRSFHRSSLKRRDAAALSPVLQACRVSDRWGKDAALVDLLLLAHVPERIIAYLSTSLDQAAFAVPDFETLNKEQSYFCPSQAFYPYRQFKEACVRDRLKFAKSLLHVLKAMLRHQQALLDDTKMDLLAVLGRLVQANATFIDSVGPIVLEMLHGTPPAMPVDSRFTALFQILLAHLQTSEMAGRCVLRLIDIAPRAEWKHDINIYLFHSDLDLKQTLALVETDADVGLASPSSRPTQAPLSETKLAVYCNLLELLAMVADGKTHESMFGHLESKSIFPLPWLVELFLQKRSTLPLKRVALILMSCLYFESPVATLQLSAATLPQLELVFQRCHGLLRDLSPKNEIVVLEGILPWLRGWYTLVETRPQELLRAFHGATLVPLLTAVHDLLEALVRDHARFTCVHTTVGLAEMTARLQRPHLCPHMAALVWAQRRLARDLNRPALEKNSRLCQAHFREAVRLKVVDAMAPILKEQFPFLAQSVLDAHRQLAHFVSNDDEVGHLLHVAEFLLSCEPQAPAATTHDLLAIVLGKQDWRLKPRPHKSVGTPAELRALPDPRKWLSSRTFRGATYESLDAPRALPTALHAPPALDLDTVAASWKQTLTAAVDAPALLQALAQLVLHAPPSWPRALGFLIHALRAKRLQATAADELDEKVLLQANAIWRKTLATAVKVGVATVVLTCIVRSTRDATNPVLSALTLELMAEFLADGYEDAQDALYRGLAASPPEVQELVATFLMQHVERQTDAVASHTHHDAVHGGALAALTLLQLLCENHHHEWQTLMRSTTIRPPQSFLDAAIGLLVAVCARGPRFEPRDMQVLAKVFAFLSEACQGPCLANQAILTESVVPKWCTLLVLDAREVPAADAVAAAKLRKNAAEVLLAMTECRTDVVVHAPLARLLPPEDVAAVLSRHRALLRTTTDAKLRHAVFEAAIELLRVAYALLAPPVADPALARYAKVWKDLENPDVDFFAGQTISVQIVRGDATVAVYFPKPPEAKYLQRPEQKRLLDAMEMGTENALSVFTSKAARSIDEELKTRLALADGRLYAWMADHALALRRWMFILCLFMNVVLVLGMRMDPETNLATMEDFVHLVFMALGAVFAVICTSLWFFHIATTASFHVAKQRLTPTKLYMVRRADVRQRIVTAVLDLLFVLAVFVAIFTVIVLVYGTDDAVTQINAVVALLFIVYSVFRALRRISGTLHYMYIVEEHVANRKLSCASLLFWYNVVFDTLVSDVVVIFTVYTLCAYLGLAQAVIPYGYLFYGVPLLDLLGTNARLANILKAVTLNLGPLGMTMAFGAIVIYVFSLIGFFFFQAEMVDGDDHPQCSTMMECFFVSMHYGLLSGGGIGDYTSNSIGHPLGYEEPVSFFTRLVYDLLFFIVVLLFLMNVIMGIIIDAFGALREAAEEKDRTAMNSCLVCNTSKDDIEYAGIRLGLRDNFTRHTNEEHNLWHYFFFIMYLNGKPTTDMNGTESFVYQKIQAKEMSWIPKNRDAANDSDIVQLKEQVRALQELIQTKLDGLSE
ncbi:type I inositol triphosphate receptor [Achlya hypogyna]|uniref:Type I inositol triphosphate receptor n=1 Tax=Achlya hypogyna TaxID=1202772 RepID=A0A1V9Z525_ACHHY|nr:type I inositol triphosphate receptor [Achlya hypogyna]